MKNSINMSSVFSYNCFKYGIKKKESPTEDTTLDGRLGRKHKGQQDETMATASAVTGTSTENDAGSIQSSINKYLTSLISNALGLSLFSYW